MKCKICNKEFKFISPSHLRYKHNIGVAEYIKNYGDTMPIKTRKRWNVNQKKNHWSKKPIEETIEIRKQLSKNGHKVMTMLNDTGKTYRFNSKTSKLIWTDEHREYIKSKITGIKRSKETREKIKQNHWSNKSIEDFNNILESIFLKNGQFKNTKKGKFLSKKSNHEMFYMSSFEYRRLQFLENNSNVEWFTTNHKINILYPFKDSNHKYTPDILVKWKNGVETLEEIKGYVRDTEKFQAKNQAAKIWCQKNNKSFFVLFENDLEMSL